MRSTGSGRGRVLGIYIFGRAFSVRSVRNLPAYSRYLVRPTARARVRMRFGVRGGTGIDGGTGTLELALLRLHPVAQGDLRLWRLLLQFLHWEGFSGRRTPSNTLWASHSQPAFLACSIAAWWTALAT